MPAREHEASLALAALLKPIFENITAPGDIIEDILKVARCEHTAKDYTYLLSLNFEGLQKLQEGHRSIWLRFHNLNFR